MPVAAGAPRALDASLDAHGPPVELAGEHRRGDTPDRDDDDQTFVVVDGESADEGRDEEAATRHLKRPIQDEVTPYRCAVDQLGTPILADPVVLESAAPSRKHLDRSRADVAHEGAAILEGAAAAAAGPELGERKTLRDIKLPCSPGGSTDRGFPQPSPEGVARLPPE